MNLFRALSYKEWMKTRRLIGVMLLLMAVAVGYTYIDLTHEIRLNEAVNVWYGCLFQGTSVAPWMMYLLPLAGIALGVVQYVPEMTQKRLKLTLHLPAGETNYGLHAVVWFQCRLAALSAAFAGPGGCGSFVSAFRGCRNDAPAVASLDSGSSGRLWLHCVGLYRAPVETADAMHCGIGGTAVHAVCFLLSRSLFTVRGRNRLDTGSFFYLSFLILHSVQVWCTIKTMNNEI